MRRRRRSSGTGKRAIYCPEPVKGKPMRLTMKVRHVDGVAVLDFEGWLVFGREGDAMRDLLLQLFEQGHRRILINLEHLEHADSGGTGELVSAYVNIKRRGGMV